MNEKQSQLFHDAMNKLAIAQGNLNRLNPKDENFDLVYQKITKSMQEAIIFLKKLRLEEP